MGYSLGDLKRILGDSFNPKASYLIETHRGAAARIAAGTHKKVGEVLDSTEDQKGTMIILEMLPPPPPPPMAKIEAPKPPTARPIIPKAKPKPKPESKAGLGRVFRPKSPSKKENPR